VNTLRALVISLFFLFPTFAFIQVAYADQAKTFNVAWTPPTKRIDGAALSIDEIGGYELYVIVDRGNADIIEIAPGTTTSKDITLTFAPSDIPHIVSFGIIAVDKNGLKSGFSKIAQKKITVPFATPDKPTITVQCDNK
jgi:hypothetical protein